MNISSANYEDEFTPDEYLSKEELLAFQNEFAEMIEYSKKYLNFLMKKIKQEEVTNSEMLLNSQIKIKEISNRISKLEEKKTNLIKDILRDEFA